MTDINEVLCTIKRINILNEHHVVYIGKPHSTFFKKYVLAHDNDFYEPLTYRIDVDAFVKKVHNLSTTFILTVDDEIAGLIAAYFYDMLSEKGFITIVHVKRAFQGRHLSTILLQATQDYAHSIRFKYIDLMVYRNNTPAFNLYRKHGFEVLEDNNGRCLMRWKA